MKQVGKVKVAGIRDVNASQTFASSNGENDK